MTIIGWTAQINPETQQINLQAHADSQRRKLTIPITDDNAQTLADTLLGILRRRDHDRKDPKP